MQYFTHLQYGNVCTGMRAGAMQPSGVPVVNEVTSAVPRQFTAGLHSQVWQPSR